jgi:putative ABC transport system permease protein
MSLALATLIYEWRRYLAAVVALAFSGLLVLAQIGMFMGIGKAFTAIIDRSPADIMILPSKAESLMNTGGLPRRIMPLIYMNPQVVQVADLDGDGAMWGNVDQDGTAKKGEKRTREWVQIMTIDPRPGSVTLPTDYTDATRIALSEPYAIALDQTALKRLKIKLGEKATLNGKTVKLKAVLTGYPNMMQPQVVMSRDTLRMLGMANGSRRVGPLMVKIADPDQADRVRDEMNVIAKGQYRAWTRAELAKANEGSMMKESIIGIMLGFSLFLGLLIGVGITSQTLRGAILANIKEFASLRALGVSMGSLRWIVLELSFWVGIAGLIATGGLVTLVALLATAGGVPMAFTPGLVGMTGLFLLLIAMLSGLMALGILKKSQPADLLR